MSSLSEELVRISEQGAAAVLATVVEVDGNARVEPGAKCLVRDGAVVGETIGDARVVEAIVQESATHLRAEKSKLTSLEVHRRQVGSFFRGDAGAAEADRGRCRAYRRAFGPDGEGFGFLRRRHR